MSEANEVFCGKHIRVLERGGWEYAERRRAREAVAVIATTGRGEVILTEQYRAPVDVRVIDWPAGLVGDDGVDDPAESARKELLEESGYACEQVERLARGTSSPGIVSEFVGFWRARGAERRESGGGVGGEDIAVHVVPRGQLLSWLKEREREGLAIDLKVWSGLYFLETE